MLLLQFRERIASLYGISKAILKVKFDGNNLKDNETFESAGIEDDDMIDLEVAHFCFVLSTSFVLPSLCRALIKTDKQSALSRRCCESR